MDRDEVCLHEYNSRWVLGFRECEKKLIDLDLELHHIGSTSIPGLTAKPILDILAVAPDEKSLDNYRTDIENLGFEWKGEYGIVGRRYAVLYDSEKKQNLVHLHIFPKNHKAVFDHLGFRDYLIQNPPVLIKYNILKNKLQNEFAKDRQSYSSGKNDFIGSVLEKICSASREIQLVGCDKSHARLLHKWRVESNLLAFNPVVSLTREELEAKLPEVPVSEENLYKNEYLRWMVKYNDLIVGTVTIKGMSPAMKYAEVGYGIGQDYQGMGIGYLAVKKMVDKVFNDTDLRRLFALVHSENQASCRVLEKIGFVKEGLLRDHYIVDGKAVDEVFYGILKRDYNG